MPYSRAAQADRARDELAIELEKAGLSELTARAIAGRCTWRIADRAIYEFRYLAQGKPAGDGPAGGKKGNDNGQR